MDRSRCCNVYGLARYTGKLHLAPTFFNEVVVLSPFHHIWRLFAVVHSAMAVFLDTGEQKRRVGVNCRHVEFFRNAAKRLSAEFSFAKWE